MRDYLAKPAWTGLGPLDAKEIWVLHSAPGLKIEGWIEAVQEERNSVTVRGHSDGLGFAELNHMLQRASDPPLAREAGLATRKRKGEVASLLAYHGLLN